jgi:hypothetical protein
VIQPCDHSNYIPFSIIGVNVVGYLSDCHIISMDCDAHGGN